jgi:type IV secretory pathway VirB3-like protein
MALSVILILGIAIFHMLVQDAPSEDSQIISNVLSMLGRLLAAITGFYFGGRSVEKEEDKEKEKGKEDSKKD